MVKVIRMHSPGNYTHHADNDRDIIFGTSGDDVIHGDDEEELYSFYWPANMDQAQIIDPSKGNWGRLINPQIESNGDNEHAFAAVKVNSDGAKPIAIDEYIDAGGGVDVVHGHSGHDWIYGGEGGDFLFGEWGNDVLMGGAGDDFIDTGLGADSVNGGIGNDTVNNIHAGGGDFLDGGADYDKLRLERSGDFKFDLKTGVGDVYAVGAHFNAINFEELTYFGGSGIDTIWGGDNVDNLTGGSGGDYLFGAGGNDQINGGFGADFLVGDDGNDRITGGDGADTIQDGNGDDTVLGNNGDDTIQTGKGNDDIFGGANDDTITEVGTDNPKDARPMFIHGHYQTSFNDAIYGEGGRDTIHGGTGRDYIDGGADTDFICGGADFDHMIGGAGADWFQFEFGDVTFEQGQFRSGDVILDFQRDVDRLNLIGINEYAKGGTLSLDDHDGTPGEAGEIMFTTNDWNDTILQIDFDGDGKVNFEVEFRGMDYDPSNPFNTGDIII